MICTIGNKKVEVPKYTQLMELAKEYQKDFQSSILVAKIDNEIKELHKNIYEDCKIEFLDMTSSAGFKVYQRTASLVMIHAVKKILGKKVRIVVQHSINKNYYCQIMDKGIVLTDELVIKIEEEMKDLIKRSLPIERHSLPVEEAIRICENWGMYDKVNLLKYRRTANVNLYSIEDFYDYFYGYMASSTDCIHLFKLSRYSDGMILQFPSQSNNGDLSEKKELYKIQQVFKESSNWNNILDVDTIGSLNNKISQGDIAKFIRINEALHEKKIGQIADMIHNQDKHIVLIAGPSSSGKTTFAKRLSVQLHVNGLKTHVISLDDYYVDRELTPRDEFGEYDFESIEALDIKQINQDLEDLLAGKTVEIPTFNFKTGKREYKGNKISLEADKVLVLEGLHGLNERLSHNIPKISKFKIFISALTQLNIDDHNRIATTDTRIIRRIVRDSKFRGFGAIQTINMWPAVLRGEIQNIFPFQEEADAVFNSSLVYELSVLKQYIDPVLFNIDKTMPQYAEARRLIKFLDSFLGVSSEYVPQNSILREFIGGSCFDQ